MIFVDDREGSHDLIPLITDCIECRLDSGDVAIAGNGPDGDVLVGVEVKKMDDLLKSISTGRLAATQAKPMFDSYYQNWLLTIGVYREGRNGELQVRGSKGNFYPYRIGGRAVPVGYLESSLIEYQTIGMLHKHVPDYPAAAVWLQRLARWWGKQWSEHKGLKKFDRSASVRVALMPDHDPVTEQIARVVKELPGLGYDRAFAAAGQFESVVEAINANVHQWQEVPGVGRVIAKAVVEACNRRRTGTGGGNGGK